MNAPAAEHTEDVQLTVAAGFLDALTRRDFAAMHARLDPAVRFRALLPPGLIVEEHADALVDRFRGWFGGAARFEIVDASLGLIGSRLYLRWRARADARIVEQHAFARVAAQRIESLDLLCSGFQPVDGAAVVPSPTVHSQMGTDHDE